MAAASDADPFLQLADYFQVRNFGFNMLESVSKTGSALAPLVVDLGGQVGVMMMTILMMVVVEVMGLLLLHK